MQYFANSHYRAYNVRRSLNRIRAWSEVKNYFEIQIIKGLCDGTIAKNLTDVASFLTYHNRPLQNIEPHNIHEWLLWERESNLKPSTFARRVITIKSFLTQIGRGDLAAAIPKIKYQYYPKKRTLSVEDVNLLVKNCTNVFERALILLLDDTGCRIQELLTLRKQDIQAQNGKVHLMVTGKTGTRPVRLVKTPNIALWLRNSVSRDEDLVFRGRGYNWGYWIFRRTRQKTGKSFHPHMFRHTKATEMSKLFTEAIVKQYMGWSKDSKMMKFYTHLSARDIDAAIDEKIKSAPRARGQ